MCSNETNYQNANWIPIQTGQTQHGTCNANYYGSPTRDCINNGSWSSVVTNPCNRITYCFFWISYIFLIEY